nr:aspartate/glutamate racemase family protein [Marinicella sp. NBU2979]
MPHINTIGLLGGMSWESTRIYYRELNQQINQHLGGLHSAPMVLVNVDFAPIERLMQAGDWAGIGQRLLGHCRCIQAAGADFLVIATNTMHKLAPLIEAELDLPLLHIADVVGQALRDQGVTTVGLLGTAFTMQEPFYRDRLRARHGIQTLLPNAPQRDVVDRVIFTELCHGQLQAESKQAYLDIIDDLAAQGAQAIILGCTEIGLLVQSSDTSVPLLDATHCHIQAAVEMALNQDP